MKNFIKFKLFFCFFISLGDVYPKAKIIVKFSEIPYVLNNLNKNDTVWIEDGLYNNQPIVISYNSDEKIVIKAISNGGVILSERSSIVFKNAKNVKLEGLYFSKMDGISIILDNSNAIEIKNVYFHECGSHPISSIIRIQNASNNNSIVNCTFNGSKAQSISIITKDEIDIVMKNNKIINNHFCNIKNISEVYPLLLANGMEAIMIGFGTDVTRKFCLNTIVQGNLFENIIGDGFEIISNKTSENIIENNIFLNNKSGITLRSGDKVLFSKNKLINTDKGLRIFGKNHIILNNYFYGSKIAIDLPSSQFDSIGDGSNKEYFLQKNILIKDNLFSNNDTIMYFGKGNFKLIPENIIVTENKFDKKNKIFGKSLNIQLTKNKGVNGLINRKNKKLKMIQKILVLHGN
jgi:parallel beta-helix repeat protein